MTTESNPERRDTIMNCASAFEAWWAGSSRAWISRGGQEVRESSQAEAVKVKRPRRGYARIP